MGNKIITEKWSSDGRMYMVKCNNPNCPVPDDGYPTGRNLDKVKEEWNRRNETLAEGQGKYGEINRKKRWTECNST